MEEIKHYYMNLNYEDELYQNSTKPHIKKILEEFDFIFFILNEENCTLITNQSFEKKYLEKLISLGFRPSPTVSESNKKLPFWGSFDDLELKKKFNSKSWFIKILKELNISTIQNVVRRDSLEFKELLKNIKNKVLIKSAHAMSGQQTYLLSTENIFQDHYLSNENEIIVSPFINKIVEFSIIISSEKSIEINISHYSLKGVFSGGLNFYDRKTLLEYLNSLPVKLAMLSWNETIDQIEKDVHKIFDKMTRESTYGLSFPFAIDALIYREKDRLKIEYLELNYRKTMGLLFPKLKKLLKPDSIGKLSITKKVRNFKNEIELSPANNKTKFYFDPNWPGA